MYLMGMDLLLTRIWQLLRKVLPDRHPPGFMQRAIDRYTVSQLSWDHEVEVIWDDRND